MPASPRARFPLSPSRRKLRIGYIRISTDSGEQLAALENQRHRVQQAGIDHLIQDVQSGREADRPGYQQLLNLIDLRQVDAVVITRIDRLSRDAAEADQTIAFAARRGVQIEALDGGLLESVTPQGFLMTRMATTMAEFESRMLSMRVKRGYEQCRLQKRPARGRCPWAYRISADGLRIEPDPTEWPKARLFIDVLRECKFRIQAGMRLFEARYGPFGLHSSRGVRGWLLNPILRGGLGYLRDNHDSYKTVVWNALPALLDPVEWLEIEQRLQLNSRRRGVLTNSADRLLTGLCVCGLCGLRMSYNARVETCHSIICHEFRCSGRGRRVRESLISEAVSAAIRKRLQKHPGRHRDTDEVRALRREVQHLQALSDPDYQPVLDVKLARLHELEAKCPEDLLTRMQAQYPPQFWISPTADELRLLYVKAVRRIVITPPDGIQIELRV